MEWTNLDVLKILQVGVIGLGFLLALLAYHLLTKEQTQETPRPDILKSIYVFMSFSVTLCVIGVASQLIGTGKGDAHSEKEETTRERKYDSSFNIHFVTMYEKGEAQLSSGGTLKYTEEKTHDGSLGNTSIRGNFSGTVIRNGEREPIVEPVFGYKRDT